MTRGHRLPAQHVIHAVGPVYRGGRSREPELLRSCYMESLRLASEAKLKSIAFPCISTGIYSYPKDEACRIAIAAVIEWLTSHDLPHSVIFCCFGADDVKLYRDHITS